MLFSISRTQPDSSQPDSSRLTISDDYNPSMVSEGPSVNQVEAPSSPQSSPTRDVTAIHSIDTLARQLSTGSRVTRNAHFRPRDRSRSQSDLHLVCEKIPEAVHEEDVDQRTGMPFPNPPKSLCKRTYSLGALVSSSTSGVQGNDYNNDCTQQSPATTSTERLLSLNNHGTYHTNVPHRPQHQSKDLPEKEHTKSPTKSKTRVLQRDNSFIQSVRTFLRPRDVKKKNKLRSRSESLPLGLSGSHKDEKRNKTRSESFTLYN